MKNYEEKIKRFIDELVEDYNSADLIKNMLVIDPFKENDQPRFFQIGRRIELPKKFFSDTDKVGTKDIADDLIKVLNGGEKLFIVEQIREKVKKVITTPQFSYEDLISAANQVDEPTDLFIPLSKACWQELHNLQYNKQIIFEQGELQLLIKQKPIKIHWSNTYAPFKNIYIINRKKIKIIQKKFKNTQLPNGLTIPEHYPKLNKDESEIMVYFGEAKNSENFDIYFRVVVSELILEENTAACKIELLNEEENKLD